MLTASRAEAKERGETSPDACRALWGYLFGMDLVKTIEINDSGSRGW